MFGRPIPGKQIGAEPVHVEQCPSRETGTEQKDQCYPPLHVEVPAVAVLVVIAEAAAKPPLPNVTERLQMPPPLDS